MARFKARSGEIYFEHRGARANPRVVLIHGLGCQLVQWPDSLIQGLVGNGLCAILFDNRDAGLSDGPGGRPPSLEALLAGLRPSKKHGRPTARGIQPDRNAEPRSFEQAASDAVTPDYTLSDMAQDTVDLLDHLGQGGAHVVGLSMGGMIAQRMAIEHPQRVYSLTSIMSSTGNPDLPGPHPDAMAAAVALTEDNAETALARHIHAWRVWGGGHFDSRESGIARFAERAVERACRPHGIIRQYAAIVADGDRRGELAGVDVPSLVIHGAADPLVPAAAGNDTANAIPGARYIEIPKLGHDLPEAAIADIVEAICGHIQAIEVSR